MALLLEGKKGTGELFVHKNVCGELPIGKAFQEARLHIIKEEEWRHPLLLGSFSIDRITAVKLVCALFLKRWKITILYLKSKLMQIQKIMQIRGSLQIFIESLFYFSPKPGEIRPALQKWYNKLFLPNQPNNAQF